MIRVFVNEIRRRCLGCATPSHELTAAGSTTYSYDANGNLTGNSAGLSLSYNALNQTASITPPGGSAIAPGTICPQIAFIW